MKNPWEISKRPKPTTCLYKCWHFWCMIHQTIFNPQISWRLIKLEYDCSELTAESRNFQWNYFTFLKLLHITPYLKRAWSINIIRTGCCRPAVRRSCGARGPGGGCSTPSSPSGRSSAAARARTSAVKRSIGSTPVVQFRTGGYKTLC